MTISAVDGDNKVVLVAPTQVTVLVERATVQLTVSVRATRICYVSIASCKSVNLRNAVPENRKLIFTVTIKDCVVTYYKDQGAGGQKKNKTESGVRITHIPSGAVGMDCSTRSQHKNKRIAWRRMGESVLFQTWARSKALNLEPIEDIVDRMMEEENLKVEYAPFEKKHSRKKKNRSLHITNEPGLD